MAKRTRGDTDIPGWEIRCMINELYEAKSLITRGFREQANKDKVLNFINTEIEELKRLPL